MFKIAIFASGSGTNADKIINHFKKSPLATVKLVISNKSEAFVHNRAKLHGIESKTFSKNDFENTSLVLNYLEQNEINFIILAGFLLKIPQNLIDRYPQRIVNIHPALLPKFGGKGMYGDNVHKAVIANKETESGITIHYINENYDEGDIIFQAKCEILPLDTYEDVAKKIHKLEYENYSIVIENLLRDL